MSLNKKVVWLPYDMDTAIGINNSGLLVFGYSLEDIDLQEGGEFIFNGQDSVLWTNLRDAFSGDIKAMYQTLRSTGAISYDKVEQMFENHQSKWCEAIFNEDAYFKYIEPLTNPESGKQPDASYLPMAQGSKAEQRKWWLYNRFRYMDSKWNAGDALTDYIMMRAYSVAPQVLTPYADIYLTTAWDGELTQVRARRGQTYTLPCPKDSANDAVVAIYSASQLADIGDLSGLKIKNGNFSMATRLQSLKVGDSDPNYSNTNLTDLQLGNNTLMKVLDVRNCPNLAITVDISGCKNIEEVYFDGTGIAGVVLPNGGVLNTLHLPDSVTNLTIQNQPNITDFVLDDASNLSTLRLENCGELMDEAINMVKEMNDGSRVRLIGVNWDMEDGAEFNTVFKRLDTDRGIDEQGGNMNIAQLQGAVHTPLASSIYFNTLQSRYPYVTFTADELTNMVKQLLEGTLTEYVDDEVETVSTYAFYGITSLTRVDLPNVTSCGNSAFEGCSNIEVFSMPKLLYGLPQKLLTNSKVRILVFPLVANSDQASLQSNAKLEIVDFGGNSSNNYGIENNCFTNCTSLRKIIIRKTTLGRLASWNANTIGGIYNNPTQSTIYVPSALISSYQTATNWSSAYAAGVTFTAIEGSEYEHYYADGTPID